MVLITIELQLSIGGKEIIQFIHLHKEFSNQTKKFQQWKLSLIECKEIITPKLILTKWFRDNSQEWQVIGRIKNTSRWVINLVLSKL